MASNVTRDHHTFTRSTVKNVSGDLALDIVGDLALSADGGNVTMDDGTTTIFDFNVDEPALKIMDDADTGDYFQIAVGASGATTITTVDADSAVAHLTLDVDGDITAKPAGGNLYIHDGSNNIFNFDAANTFMRIYDDDDTADHFTTTVSSGGGVIMQATHGSSLPAGSYIKLVADDHVRVTSDFYIDATKKLYLDEGGDTYIHETSGDKLEVVVGGDVMARLTENGLDGNYFSFRLASAGFGALSCVAGASPILGAGGTVTDIDFRGTNKAFIADTDTAISQMNLIFPPMDANFVLVLRYSGDFSVAAWVAHEYDESVATGSASGNVLWPGGTLPDNTSGGFDVFSFFWDSNAQRCYGVASLAFDVP